MEERLQEAQKLLLQYNIPQASQALIDIFDGLLQIESQMNQEQQERFQSALQQLNRAMQNQDYLLTVDLLEYEIRPLVSLVYQ